LISRTPASGKGSDCALQNDSIRPRTAVTARNAGCLVSISFLVARRNGPSASNASAARAFWAAVSAFWTPNQVNDRRTAAIVVRSRSAGVAADRSSMSMRSSKLVVLMKETPEGR
jgi:hypothetical protein